MKFIFGAIIIAALSGGVGFGLGSYLSDSNAGEPAAAADTSDQSTANPLTATPTPQRPSPTTTPSRTATALGTTSVIRVELVGKTFVPKDIYNGRFSDGLNFEFQYTNTGNQEIRGFTGTAVFMDLFSRPIKQLTLTYDSAIRPGQSVRDTDKGYELNQFIDADQKLGTTALDNLRFRFDVQAVLFADGTQAGSVP